MFSVSLNKNFSSGSIGQNPQTNKSSFFKSNSTQKTQHSTENLALTKENLFIDSSTSEKFLSHVSDVNALFENHPEEAATQALGFVMTLFGKDNICKDGKVLLDHLQIALNLSFGKNPSLLAYVCNFVQSREILLPQEASSFPLQEQIKNLLENHVLLSNPLFFHDKTEADLSFLFKEQDKTVHSLLSHIGINRNEKAKENAKKLKTVDRFELGQKRSKKMTQGTTFYTNPFLSLKWSCNTRPDINIALHKTNATTDEQFLQKPINAIEATWQGEKTIYCTGSVHLPEQAEALFSTLFPG